MIKQNATQKKLKYRKSPNAVGLSSPSAQKAEVVQTCSRSVRGPRPVLHASEHAFVEDVKYRYFAVDGGVVALAACFRPARPARPRGRTVFPLEPSRHALHELLETTRILCIWYKTCLYTFSFIRIGALIFSFSICFVLRLSLTIHYAVFLFLFVQRSS